MTPRWILWAEILVILAILGGLGIARFARITAPEAREIQLEAGLLQLYEMEMDHFARKGEYFHPDDPTYRAYLPWMELYTFEARHGATEGFSVVVHADLDGDGELGAWRVDESMPEAVRIAAD